MVEDVQGHSRDVKDGGRGHLGDAQAVLEFDQKSKENASLSKHKGTAENVISQRILFRCFQVQTVAIVEIVSSANLVLIFCQVKIWF